MALSYLLLPLSAIGLAGVRAMRRRNRLPQAETHSIKASLILQSGKKCQGCGYPFPRRLNEHQLARENGAFELDHKIPLDRGGSNERSNLQVLCLPCHDGKTNEGGKGGNRPNMTDAEWRAAGKPQDWARKKGLMGKSRQKGD